MKIDAKEIATLIKTLSKTANTKHFTSAVIAAAGSGTRMNTDKTKQLLTLCDIPVIVRTIQAFEDCEFINEIIIAAKPDETDLYPEFIKKYGFKKIKAVVPGKSTRQESVLAGFEAISDESEFVAIHDGARCLITPKEIENVLKAAYSHGAATAACKVSDTIKKIKFGGIIDETVNRDSVMLAQTPQVFKTELYRAAAYVAKDEGFSATDDNMLVENIGYPIKTVECTKENLKLTTKFDLILAKAILKSRE